jgi:hypothetical protein
VSECETYAGKATNNVGKIKIENIQALLQLDTRKGNPLMACRAH